MRRVEKVGGEYEIKLVEIGDKERMKVRMSIKV